MDTAWVLAARAGDRRAFARLVDSHFRAVYGVAFSTVGRWDGAEDVAQETFLVAWKQLKALRTPEAFSGWICSIARNLARNWLRSTQYRITLAEHLRKHAGPVAVPGLDASERIEEDERREAVWEALQSLSPPLREVVVLYYLEGHSVAEVAAALGVAEATVRKRLQYARPKLRAYFEKQWAAEVERERERLQPGDAARRFLAGVALGPMSASLEAARRAAPLNLLATATASLRGAPAAVASAMAAVALVVGVWVMADTGDPGSADAGPRIEVASTSVLEPPQAGASTELLPPVPSTVVEEPTVAPASSNVVPPATVAATAVSGGVIRGVVLDGDGRPVAGAKVTAYATGTALPAPPKSPVRSIGSSYRFDLAQGSASGVPSGVPGDLPAFLARRAMPVTLEQARYQMAVSTALDDPSRRFTTVCGADGTFEMRDALLGTVIVQAIADGYQTNGATVVLRADSPEQETTIVLPPGVDVYGVVLGADGQPAADARLRCIAQVRQQSFAGGVSGQAWGAFSMGWGWTFVDGQGRVRLPVADFGLLTVQVASLTRGTVTFTGIPAELGKPLELRLPKSSSLRGRVTHPNGAPASGYTLVLTGHAAEPTEGQDSGSVGGGGGAGGISDVAACVQIPRAPIAWVDWTLGSNTKLPFTIPKGIALALA